MTSDEHETRKLAREVLAVAAPRETAAFERQVLESVRQARAAGGEAGGRPHTKMRGLAAATAVLAVMLLLTALAPPTRSALADTPLVRSLLARFYGGQGSPAPLAEATSSGYTVRVMEGYDDGNRVILIFDAVHADGSSIEGERFVPGPVQVTDSAGNQLQSLKGNLIRRAAGGPPAGSSLKVQVHEIYTVPSTSRTRPEPISGSWSFDLKISPSAAPTPLPAPPDGQLGPVSVKFDQVLVSDAYLSVRFVVAGLPPNFNQSKGGWMDTVLYGPDGDRVQSLQAWPEPAGQPTSGPRVFEEDWQLSERAGTYHLVVTAPDGEKIDRTITVPNGRSPRVPRLEPALRGR